MDSLSSKAKILLLWVDEAEPVSSNAWAVNIPTVREEGAEIWVTWNPDRKKSASHIRFRQSSPEGSKIVDLNWRDNPFFPKILNATRLDDLKNARINTIGYGMAVSKRWSRAPTTPSFCCSPKNRSGLISSPLDPLMQVRAYFDIGGKGAGGCGFNLDRSVRRAESQRPGLL